jgi:hypothetical protein
MKVPKPFNWTAKFESSSSLTAQPTFGRLRTGESLEKRVADLERQAEQLEGALHGVRNLLQIEQVARGEEIKREVGTVRAEIAGLRRLVEEFAAGGLSFEAMGLVWLLSGTIVGALPEELAFVARWVLCLTR